ncbi:XRE family transcriptional regulator [Butyrivibrio sp. CB08]|nr:XRE family transcriptional regulator [Butyrivibrio sp. CB08]
MEFSEKLQELRKKKDMTQEELAEALYVSRTAISKWESGRGYPSIDSLKEISKFFSVSIDELLSAEKMVSIAEKENRDNIRHICNMLFGAVDLMAVALIVLPIYPNLRDGFYYAVSLPYYTQTSNLNLSGYWVLFVLLVIIGAVKVLLTKLRVEKGQSAVTAVSMIVGVLAVLFLGMAREAYGVTILFLMIIAKGILIYKMR